MKNLLRLLTISALLLGGTGCASKAMVQRARGTAVEKHGVRGTVTTEPSPWHYALVPFAACLDLILCPIHIASLIQGEPDAADRTDNPQKE